MVHLVSSAAWPLGGNEHRPDVVVGEDSSLTIRSAAASMAHWSPTAANEFEPGRPR